MIWNKSLNNVDLSVMLCKCHTRDACRLHAGCMQPATSCMQDAATCNLLHTIARRLHEACMKPAWSLHAGCNLLHAACCNLQPPAYDRIHKKRDNRHNFSSTPTCRASSPTLRRRRLSNHSKFYDVASCSLCTFDFFVTITTVEQLFISVNSTTHK